MQNGDCVTIPWTGRGRKPNWLVDALKKGGKMDCFAICGTNSRQAIRSFIILK